jgi:uncharacterized protein (TIGR03545 family)
MAGVSWIKKGPLYRLLGGGIFLWAIVFFFFDPALKYGLIKAGEKAAGARVEIGSLKSHWLRGSLEIHGIAVADRAEPMKNVVEFSRAAFRLDVGALLRGKAVVREAALEGLRLGTPRTRSGSLPHPPPPSKMELEIRDKISPIVSAQTKTVVATVDATKLQGLKKLDEAKAKGAEIEQRWKGKQAEAQDIAKQAQVVGDELKSLGGGGDPLQKIARAAAAQKKLKELISRVDAQKKQAQSDLAEVQGLVKQADELRGKDVNGLLSAAGLPTLDSQDLARRLLGAQTASRLATTLHWLKWAKDRAAARKAAAKAPSAPPPPARRKGVDVEFPRATSYPQFLLENAVLSGSLEKIFMGQDMALAGKLNGVTSNPELYGRPATLDLSGDAAGGTSLKMAARLDQQNSPVGVGVKFSGTGFSLAGAALGDGSVGGTVTEGRARATGEIRSAGDEWLGEIFVEASGVKIEPKVALGGAAAGLVSDALKSLNAFSVKIGISGKEGDLHLSFSSNAGDVVAAAMKKAVSGQFEAQRKALQAKVDALYSDKLKGVQAQTHALSGQLLGPLDAQRAGLEGQLQDALKRSIGGVKLPNLNKLFR